MKAFAFVDLMDNDTSPPITVLARLRLLSTEEGGRRAGIRTGYRPNHNFGPADGCEFYIGQVDFTDREVIAPGESADIAVRFISGPGLRAHLKVGCTWRIQEGPKLVGIAGATQVA